MARLTDDERAMARGVHVVPAADGRYYDPIHAAIADRDDLLDELKRIRAAVEAMPTRHPHGVMAQYQHVDKPSVLRIIDGGD